jgi:hypothetical protein
MAETRFSINHHRRMLLNNPRKDNPRKTRPAATAADGYFRVSSLHSDGTDSGTITEINLRGQVISASNARQSRRRRTRGGTQKNF